MHQLLKVFKFFFLNNYCAKSNISLFLEPDPKVSDQDISLDPFEESFQIPSTSTSKVNKKSKLQPPSVATGKAYQQYVEKIEQLKKDKAMDKEKKKQEWLNKKRQKETEKLQKKSKSGVNRATKSKTAKQ